jgi:NADPH-dependent 2,4-dienoyl-CoA reductase/sulfur reductase-like enzyme
VHLLVVGGSDAGVAAGLRARELDPSVDVTVVVADQFPNFSICGIPYHVGGDVPDWRDLAHRTTDELRGAGLDLRLGTVAVDVDPARRRLRVHDPAWTEADLAYDELVLATGARPVRPPITGLEELGPADRVFLLHSMGDALDLTEALTSDVRRVAIVGAGYVGLEMAEALVTRGLEVVQLERLPEVLPTVDPELGRLVRDRLLCAGVDVRTSTAVTSVSRCDGTLRLGGAGFELAADLVLVVAGVRPESALAERAGAMLGVAGAVRVDARMRTGVPHVWAAGDCAATAHRLLGETYLPLGTTAHKQGRVAGENAVGGDRAYAGSLGTQVVKVFDLAAARTGLRDGEAAAAGFDPVTVQALADDRKAYYTGAHEIALRVTADRRSRRLLGVQLVGHRDACVAKRVDVAAVAIHHGMTVDELADLDLSYTPPLGTPWDAVQTAAQAWERAERSAAPERAPRAGSHRIGR